MYRLLEDGVNNKFQTDQINLSHVNALVKKNALADVTIPQTNDPVYEGNNVYSCIPPDLYWLINLRTETVINPLNCETAPTVPTTTVVEYVNVLKFPTLSGSSPYLANLQITSSTLGVLYNTSGAILSAGITNVNSKYVIVNNIIETLYRYRTGGLKVYWERYRDNYYQDSFIFVSETNPGAITMTSGSGTQTTSQTTTSYTKYNRGLIPAGSKTEITSSKVTDGQYLYQSLGQNQFYATRKIEPIISQTQDYFIAYTNTSFIVTRMYYDYIRKPRTISLFLNQSCELADTTHPKVVDLAVEILRLDTKDPSYQATVQDTMTRTQ